MKEIIEIPIIKIDNMTDEKTEIIQHLQTRLKTKFSYTGYTYLDKGWSPDYKFIAKDSDGSKILIRIMKAEELEEKKSRYSNINRIPQTQARYSLPLEYGRLLALYAAKNLVASIPWAYQFGEAEIKTMKTYADMLFENYNGFDSVVPEWYFRTGTQRYS